VSTAETAGVALSQAQAMIDVRHYAEASKLLAQLLAAEPSGPGWSLMAAARLGEGDHTGALDAANQAIALSPADGWPHRLASSALWNLRHYPESLRAALEARRLEPGSWQSHTSVAQAAVSACDLQLAAAAANEALRLAPEEPDVRYAAGSVRFALSDYQGAEAHQKRVLAANPAHAGALNELGRLALDGHNPVGAVRMFARAAAAAPESPVYARNVELAVIRAAALVIYVMAAAGAVVVMVCTGLKLPVIATMVPLAVTWIAVGCLLALAGWFVPAATRRAISRIARRRHVAVPIGIIAAGAAGAVVSIPLIINVITGAAPGEMSIPYFTPLIVIVISRVAAMVIWRDWHQTRR
jgi:tetratricopeptide (TPR) repeat protein